MKKITPIVLLFFLLPLALFQQVNNRAIEIIADDKPTIHGFSYWGEVKISSKDTNFYYALHSNKPDIIGGLKPDVYTITFTSIFNKSVAKIVDLNKKKKCKVKFKGLNSFYKKAPEMIMLSERIKNNDTLYIIYSNNSSGAIEYEKLGITKKDGNYIALQFKGLTTDVFQEMGIVEAQYKQVVKFETQIKSFKKNPTCTSPSCYTIALNGEVISFKDESCYWKNLDFLKANLFMQISK